MSENTIYSAHPSRSVAGTPSFNLLNMSAGLWLGAAIIGQWFFAAYIAIRYGIPVLGGNYAAVNQGGGITGYVEGQDLGNFIYFAHILPAIWLSVGGVLQFLPQIRQRWPAFHRINGRAVLLLGLCGALTGLYLSWVRGSRLSDWGALGITLNGLLIPIAVVIAWRYARLRDFTNHKRWAIHSFFLINGVWTFRLMLFGWLLVNQGPNGNSANLDGPVDLFISFACYLLPMAVAELVFWAQRRNTLKIQWLVAFVVSGGAVTTALGVVAVLMIQWWPVMSG